MYSIFDIAHFQPQNFGKVAVLMGGTSAEREVSIQSGQMICKACEQLGLDVHSVLLGDTPLDDITHVAPHFACNIVHGGYGENGQLTAMLECMHLVSCSSPSYAMMLAMNKTLSKILWRNAGLPTPAWVSLHRQSSQQALEKITHAGLQLPLVIKPANEGSSFGLYIARSKQAMYEALDYSLSVNHETLVETLIEGDEITVGIVGKTILPPIRIVPDGGVYDYRAKYLSDNTYMVIPTGLGKQVETDVQNLAKRAFGCLGCSVWGRVDLMRDSQSGNLYLIEINTLPGMTDHSLVPRAAQFTGVSFTQLVAGILTQSLLESKTKPV